MRRGKRTSIEKGGTLDHAFLMKMFFGTSGSGREEGMGLEERGD